MTCAQFNRGPFKPAMVVQDGWFNDGYTRTPKLVSVPFRMKEPCQFQIDDKYALPDCVGCSHKQAKGNE